MLEISVRGLEISEVKAIRKHEIPASYRILGICWLHYMLLYCYKEDTVADELYFKEAEKFYNSHIEKETGVMYPPGVWSIIKNILDTVKIQTYAYRIIERERS